jgi:hypothetical protein
VTTRNAKKRNPPNEFGGYKYGVPTGRGVGAVDKLEKYPSVYFGIFKEKAMREYKIWFADTLIGTTFLEGAEPSIAAVFGKIMPVIDGFGYDYIKKMCSSSGILATYDYQYQDTKSIDSGSMEQLSVVTLEGKVIKGLSIEGTEGEGFVIVLEGVMYPFYAEEFPQQCADHAKFFEGQI